MLYGEPGCGKSSIVSAIANYVNRSIKSIPIKNIKTNNDIDIAMDDIQHDDITLSNNEYITTFDEIDSINISLIKSTNNNIENINNNETEKQLIIMNSEQITQESLFKPDDPLDIGYLLSKLDGNEDQDNTIILATCNDISKFDFTLYRNGRFKLMEIKYIGRNQIKKMIEYYTKIQLTDIQMELIRDDRKIQTLNIKQEIAKYIYKKEYIDNVDINNIIDIINKL